MKWVSMFAYHLVLDSPSLKSQIHLYCNTQCQSTSCCYLFNDPAYLYTITDKLFTPVLFVFDLLNTVRLYSIQYCFYISYLNRRIVNITLPDIYRVLLAFYLCIEFQVLEGYYEAKFSLFICQRIEKQSHVFFRIVIFFKHYN